MKLRAPNYAEVASTLALALALGTGGAYAADLIRSDDIARKAVTSKHIKNGTVKRKDLSSTVKAKLDTAGPAGPTGPRGFSAWDTIPSGVTVKGQAYMVLRGTSGSINVSLPAAAPTPLTDATVNYGGTSTVTGDDDPTCTGTYANPTAPAGKVCIYEGSTGSATMSSGLVWEDPALRTRAFYVNFVGAPTDVGSAYFTWAYTAP